MINIDKCKHWGCNKSGNKCTGCGVVICPSCLLEPKDCRCENKDECCSTK
jgi:hypothetical protein